MDFLKLQGGVLRADEIQRVLREMREDVSDVFELHYTEIEGPDGPRFSPTLFIEPRRDADLLDLARRVAAKLLVAPTATYADGVANGRYAPLSCKAFEPGKGKKTKRMVRE